MEIITALIILQPEPVQVRIRVLETSYRVLDLGLKWAIEMSSQYWKRRTLGVYNTLSREWYRRAYRCFQCFVRHRNRNTKRVYNTITNSGRLSCGMYNIMSGSTSLDKYGTYNVLSSGTSSSFGTYNIIGGGIENVGTYNDLDSSGNAYGTRNLINTTGGRIICYRNRQYIRHCINLNECVWHQEYYFCN